MTRLLIWRHGQTGWNAADRIQGQTDVDLDATGRAQAAAAATRLAAQHPDVIVSSDLRRAADTAAALGAATGLPVHTDARLRERHFGAWQGLTGVEVTAAYPEQSRRWRRGETIEGCGVEDLDDLAKRVAAGVADAIDRAGGGTVVVATHGGSAKYALGELLGWSREVTSRIMGLANCHWSELRFRPVRGWSLWAHNIGVEVAGAEAGDARAVGAEVAGAEPGGSGPTWALTLPGAGKSAAGEPDRTVTGTIMAGADGRCLVLTTATGEQYQLLNGDPAVVREGARLAVTGHPAVGVSTTCMQGVPFTVTTAEAAG